MARASFSASSEFLPSIMNTTLARSSLHEAMPGSLPSSVQRAFRAASSLSIAFGNFKRGYYVVDRVGTRMLRDPYTNKPYVGFYTTKRVGGMVVNSEAIKIVKFAVS